MYKNISLIYKKTHDFKNYCVDEKCMQKLKLKKNLCKSISKIIIQHKKAHTKKNQQITQDFRITFFKTEKIQKIYFLFIFFLINKSKFYF